MDRRTSLKWVLAASASLPLLRSAAFASGTTVSSKRSTAVGSDPLLIHEYHPGELWPLTFTPRQRQTATALSDLIIPADATSKSASQVGVVDFLDEWISAPYEEQRQDRKLVLEGFQWLDRESGKRHRGAFAQLEGSQQRGICDDICLVEKAKPAFANAAKFFARYRDLTAGGFYTTAEGRKDLQYVGNIPLARFDGPPLEVLKRAGLA